jgi:hypothetical protein
MAVVGGLGLAAGAASATLGAGEITSALKIHKEAFQQDKRFFYAGYTEAVAHHGEAYAQAERLHSQSFAQGEAAYYQADRHHRRSFEQAKLQHRLDRDIAMRSEIRNGLRDEFGQKNNRYNALMICQTVILTSAFMLTLAELPADPDRADKWATYSWVYSVMLGLAFGVLSLSLWFNFIVSRRLNQFTAGVMQVEMHLDQSWREKRGVDDVTDAALVRDHFRRWFQRHCGLQAALSTYGFMVGLIILFFAVSILVDMKLALKNKLKNVGMLFFFILCGATLVIVGLEIRERSLTKKKEGVYARPWVNKLTSSLKDQMMALRGFETQPLAAQGLDGDDRTEEQGMMLAGTEETVARRHCPEAPTVVGTSTRCAKAAKTEQLLEKAWRMFQENQQREKNTKHADWERDDWMSDILTEVRLLSHARQAAHAHDSDDDDADISGDEDEDDLAGSQSAAGQSAVSDGMGGKRPTRKIDDASSLAPSRVSRTPSQVTAVDEIDATQLRKKLGVYFRSTMVHITNATDVKLHLKTRHLISGSWFTDCAPPTTIDPHTEVIFASTSKVKWVGGTEAEISYDTRGEGQGPPSEFRLTWFNGVLAGDRGRYCEAEVLKVTEKSRGPTSIGLSSPGSKGKKAGGGTDEGPGDTYFVAKDDDDQEENSEVFFTITSQKAAEEHASQFGEGSYIQPRKGSSISAQETVMSGFLNKRRPDGLGFFWQLRYFMLTRSRLSYFRAQADTRAHAQLGQLSMQDVIAVQLDKGSTEFVVVIANSQRAPYTLKAETPDEARRWADAIEMHAPRIAMMKAGGGASSVGSGSVASDSRRRAGRDRETGELRGIAEEDGASDGNGHGGVGDDAESLNLPPRGARARNGNGNSHDAQGGDDDDGEEEQQEEEGVLWDGLAQPRRRSQQDQDDGASVSTRLMFASDDGAR